MGLVKEIRCDGSGCDCNAYRQGQLDLIKRLEEWDCQGCRSVMEELGTVCPSCDDWRDELARLRRELERDEDGCRIVELRVLLQDAMEALEPFAYAYGSSDAPGEYPLLARDFYHQAHAVYEKLSEELRDA